MPSVLNDHAPSALWDWRVDTEVEAVGDWLVLHDSRVV